MADQPVNAVDLAANLTIAWLNNPNVRANGEDATAFLQSMHSTLTSFDGQGASNRTHATPEVADPKGGKAQDEAVPAVTVRKSLASRDHIISLIDGKPYRALKRHLSSHGLTPNQYRERYGLKPDYPMVAPAYAESRRELAKKIGLGRKPGQGRKAAATAKPAARRGTGRRGGRPKA